MFYSKIHELDHSIILYFVEIQAQVNNILYIMKSCHYERLMTVIVVLTKNGVRQHCQGWQLPPSRHNRNMVYFIQGQCPPMNYSLKKTHHFKANTNHFDSASRSFQTLLNVLRQLPTFQKSFLLFESSKQYKTEKSNRDNDQQVLSTITTYVYILCLFFLYSKQIS